MVDDDRANTALIDGSNTTAHLSSKALLRGGNSKMATMFNHMGLTVSNLERSIEFYCDHLGLPKPPEGHIFPIEGEWLSQLVGADDPLIQVAFVPLDHGVLELLQYKRPGDGNTEATLHNWDAGSAHLALNMPNLMDFFKEKRNQLPFLSEPQIVASGPWQGGYVVYLTDPDGNSVELVDS